MDGKNPFQPFGRKGFLGLLSARVAKLNDIRRGLADSTLVNTDAPRDILKARIGRWLFSLQRSRPEPDP